jgi:plasmid stabilization system protein ParE
MSWRVIARAGVQNDVAEAATWYEEREPGLGADFIDEVFSVWDALGENPWLNSRRDPRRNVRWRLAQRFPYRIVYEIDEGERIVIIYGVIHAARDDRHWKRRL